MTPVPSTSTARPLTPGLGLHRFRGDIQGLRAVAVLVVLLFHAGLTGLPGGFLGVDVFFVISGYLITGLLLKEVDRTGRIALGEFYARRARRILPAALAVALATLVAGMLTLPAAAWAGLGSTAVAVVLSVVNWVLADSSADYFASEQVESPFQHYWSLAVEEQYYLLWPLLVLGITVGVRALRRPRAALSASADTPSGDGAAPARQAGDPGAAPSVPPARTLAWRVLAAALVVGAVSLTHSIAYTAREPARAYFVTTTRVWELAVGAALAAAVVLLPVIPRALRVLAGWAGLGLIGWSVLHVTGAMHVPGAIALVPVLGSALLILAGVHEDGAAAIHPARLLSTAPMRWVGDLSYSLYLVHWPILALCAWHQEHGLPQRTGLALAAASVPLAWALRRWVELPAMRARRLGSRRRALRFGVGSMGAAALAASAVVVAGAVVAPPTPAQRPDMPGVRAVAAGEDPLVALTSRTRIVPDPAVADQDRSPANLRDCQVAGPDTTPRPCEFGDPGAGTVIALLGDSHASQWTAPLEVLAAQRGWRVVSYTKNSCPVTLGLPLRGDDPYPECRAWNDALPDVVADLKPDLILVSNAPHAIQGDPRTADAMAAAWRRLAPDGTRIAAILDPPWPRRNIPRCLETHADDPDACAYDKQESLGYSGTPDLLAAAAQDPAWGTIDLNDLICPGPTQCAPVVGGTAVFLDSSHLAATFARSMAPELGQRIDALLG